MDEHEQFTVERYLDQVKILTALATTLLITPNLFLTLLEKAVIRERIEAAIPYWKNVMLFTNIMFLLSILLTYLIYSSIVGQLIDRKVDLYRPATRVFSILQILFIILGCAGLLVIFNFSL